MSAYAVRLVELLLQFQGTKQKKLVRKIDIDDLCALIGLKDKFLAKKANKS